MNTSIKAEQEVRNKSRRAIYPWFTLQGVSASLYSNFSRIENSKTNFYNAWATFLWPFFTEVQGVEAKTRQFSGIFSRKWWGIGKLYLSVNKAFDSSEMIFKNRLTITNNSLHILHCSSVSISSAKFSRSFDLTLETSVVARLALTSSVSKNSFLLSVWIRVLLILSNSEDSSSVLSFSCFCNRTESRKFCFETLSVG